MSRLRSAVESVRAYGGVWLVFLTGLCLTGLATWASLRWVTTSAQHRFEAEAQRVHQELDSYFERLVGTMMLLREGAKSGSHSSRGDWDRLLDSVPLKTDFPAVKFIGVAERILNEDRAVREGRWKREYGGGFRFHPDLPVPQRNPGLKEFTNSLLPIIYVLPEGLPFNGISPYHGLDLVAIPVGTDMHDVLAHKIIGTIGRLPMSLYPAALIHSNTLGDAATRLPITVPMRWMDDLPVPNQRQGTLICAVDMGHLFVGAFEKTPPDFGLRLTLTLAAGNMPTPVYCTDQSWPQTSEQPAVWLRTTEKVMLYENRLRCEFWTTRQFDRDNYRRAWWLVALAGTAVTLLTSGFVAMQIRARLVQADIAEQLRESNVHLAVAARERARLSRDLHDGTIQNLYALGLELGRVRTLMATDTVNADVELGRTLTTLQAAITELRQFVLELEPEAWQGQTLRGALDSLTTRLRRTTQLQFNSMVAPEADSLPAKAAIHLLQLVREGLSNVLRHAGAKNVWVQLSLESQPTGKAGASPKTVWRLEIRDDGVGFEVAAGTFYGGRGLRSFRERATELEGDFEVHSSPGGGVRIVITFPQPRIS